jgi:hypothetical protein
MTGDPYDAPLSALRDHVDDLGAWLAIWEGRHEPDAHARRCASDAVDAIDAALREMHTLRSRLVGEIRTADDASAARADELLEQLRGGSAMTALAAVRRGARQGGRGVGRRAAHGDQDGPLEAQR